MKITELMDLKGKRALVTGGAGHIGPVAAQVLMELGAEVIISDRNPHKLGNKAKELGLDDNHWLAADLTQEPDMAMLPRFASDRMFGPLDIFVHCAALTGLGEGIRQGWATDFEHQSVQSFRYSLDVGLTAPFVICQEMLKDKPDTTGIVVLFSSIYGLVAPAMSLYEGIEGVPVGPAGYSATKGGQIALTRHLASVMAPDFRVNCLVPGGIQRGQPAEFVQRYSSRTLLGIMGVEDDMRGAIAFLCSEMSGYMTGATLVVDGGFTAI